jgi:hypothetical protein
VKARHALALSLAIGAPLWLRQYRLERQLGRWAEQRDQDFIDYASDTSEALNGYIRDLNRQLKKAFG